MTTVGSPSAIRLGVRARIRSHSPSSDSPLPAEAIEIQFNEANGKDVFALRPEATHFKVHPSEESQMNHSSSFHFTTVVDYSWDTHYNFGRLISTHMLSKFIAYVVRAGNVGAIRIFDMDSKERVLIKGDKGFIRDVDFLHKPKEIIVGFIDEYGTFYINKIVKDVKSGKLTAHQLIKVTMNGSPIRMDSRRFIWCKYVPDDLKEVATLKDCAYHFAVVQNDVIYGGNLVQLVQKYREGSHDFNDIRDDFLHIDTHSETVTDASFAPDGTVLATSSKDGTVKFFQVNFHEKGPAECLDSSSRHDGRPIEKILFLDNHTIRECRGDSQYWKFMVTASENMTELKLFSHRPRHRSWECLQTLNFCTSKPSKWKVEIDLKAQYLVATDIHRKGMYLIHLDYDDNNARFDWVREFSMPWNIISFNISSVIFLKPDEVMEKGFDPSNDELDLLEINIIQPRSLQQGSVVVNKSPDLFPRLNWHHRISFNNDVAFKDMTASAPEEEAIVDDEEVEEPQNIGNDQLLSSKKITSQTSVTGMDEPSAMIMNAADIDLDLFDNGNISAVLQMKEPEIKSHQSPQVLDKVNSIEKMMMDQANEMQYLKREVNRLIHLQGSALKAGEDSSIMSQVMESNFKQNQMQMNRLEGMLRINSKRQLLATQPANNNISTNLAELLAVSIGNIVKNEIETIVPQSLERIFDPSRRNVNTQIERLTSIVEAKLTHNISQILQREKIWQNITANFKSITTNVFETTFDDIFTNSVFPLCQTAVHELLTQVNDTFKQGTRQYLSGLEDVLERERQRKREDFQELIGLHINSMQDALGITLQEKVEAQMLNVLGGFQGGIVQEIEDSLSRELIRAFKDQQSYFDISVIPQTLTPAVSISESESIGGSDPALVQRQLLALAKNGDLFNAFVQASNHGDVHVLLHLCKNFEASKVFAVKLPTHVHVSIMHLLALDILDETDTKINYLNAGLGSLDMSDRKTLKSITRMIPVFQAAVTKFTERYPGSKLLSRIKLLEMVFHGISQQINSSSTSSQSLSQHSFSQYQ